MRITICLLMHGMLAAFSGNACAEEPSRPNVLFIIVDDMNDWVGCLEGHPDVMTPNIDRLAARGMLFTQAHCVSPICGPSRASVLTGMRPETTGVYTNKGRYINYVPDTVALPGYFRNNGYRTMGAGKINHGLGEHEPENWDEYGPGSGVLGTPFINEELHSAGMNPTRKINRGNLKVTLPANGGISLIDRPTMTWDSFDWGPLDVTDDDFPDGKVANWGADQLAKKHDQPFFLSVGYYKPHQPFFTPRKYFDMYDAKRVRLPETIAGDLHDVPPTGQLYATQPWSSGTHKTVATHGKWREAVRAYLATITFTDALVGTVVDALDKSEHADNTWIFLWSDHGWTLGQKHHWGKYDPWSPSLRVPMIIVPPNNNAPEGFRPGVRCDALVSLLDLYPTLVDACDLPPREELQGRSVVPLLSNPSAAWSEAVASTIGRGTHSIRTRHWRYVRYYDGSEELYDLSSDPHEWFNLAKKPELGGVKSRLRTHAPRDPKIKQLVRWGRWKYVLPTDGKSLLFDMESTFGISESIDVSEDNPAVVGRIAEYLAANKIATRYVTMPILESVEPILNR